LVDRAVAERESELTEQLVGREKSFDATQLLAVRREHEDGGRPADAVAVPHRRILLDVDPCCYKILTNERRHRRRGIHLGFQPSAAASLRGGGEVEQNGLVFPLCASERRVD